MPKIYILNTTILTTPGLSYDSEIIGERHARSLVFGDCSAPAKPGDTHTCIVGATSADVISAIGHESTAAIASIVLGRPVPVNRIEAKMQAGDIAVCIKLRGRPPEGVILSREQIEAIGYDLVLLTAHDPADRRARWLNFERCLDLISLPDDPAPYEAEQTPGTRRRGNWPCETCFVVRYWERDGGGYVGVSLDWGTQAWECVDLTTAQAREATQPPADPSGLTTSLESGVADPEVSNWSAPPADPVKAAIVEIIDWLRGFAHVLGGAKMSQDLARVRHALTQAAV